MRSVFALFLFAGALCGAGLTGKWSTSFGADGTTRQMVLYLKADGNLLTGYISSNNGNEAIEDGRVVGNTLSFSIERDNFGEKHRSTYGGTLEDSTLALQMPGYEGRRGPVRQFKQISTEEPAPMPAPAPKISLPEAAVVPYNGLAKTPPMGWNSWNKFANKVSDQLIRETADAMVSNGMKAAGYEYINIDDTWQAGRDAQGNIQTNNRFPDMKALADYVHGKGLKIGIYSSPGPKTCGGYEGSFRHEEQDAKTYAQWGMDYLKYDWCTASQVYDYHSMRAVYAKMGSALQATGKPIVFALCQYGVLGGPEWGASVGGNVWRTTGDISDNWKSMSHIGFDLQPNFTQFSNPGHWNDPDMLEVGNGGMTETEYCTHMSLWSLLAAPLLAGNDLRSMAQPIHEILTNQDVIAIDQDPLGKQATRITKNGDLEVWGRPLQSGGYAVGLFNRGEQPAKVSVAKSDLKLDGDYSFRDIWSHGDGGKLGSELSADVPPHGVVLFRLTAIKGATE